MFRAKTPISFSENWGRNMKQIEKQIYTIAFTDYVSNTVRLWLFNSLGQKANQGFTCHLRSSPSKNVKSTLLPFGI